MTDARTPRTLLVSDHLWQVFEQMAAEMGSELDGLLNQALFAFARRNGYLVPGTLRPKDSAQAGPGAQAGALPPDGVQQAGPLDTRSTKRPRKSGFAPARPAQDPVGQHPRGQEQPPRRPGLRETAAPKGSGKEAPAPAQAPGDAQGAAGRTLVLLADGREIDRIRKDRFVIGRGKHCDLVIHSGKVSREHAVISREGDAWFIEDLGSSNGTWFDQRRITRRQIHEGDEYFISAERLGCAFR